MATRGRSVLASFRGEANLRRALRELEALGVPAKGIVRMSDRPERERLGGRASPCAAKLARKGRDGLTFLLVPVVGDEKDVSLAMLRHSDGPVEVTDRFED